MLKKRIKKGLKIQAVVQRYSMAFSKVSLILLMRRISPRTMIMATAKAAKPAISPAYMMPLMPKQKDQRQKENDLSCH